MNKQQLEDMTCVVFFLMGAAKDNQMCNSHRADDALKAACRLFGVDEARLKLKDGGFIP